MILGLLTFLILSLTCFTIDDQYNGYDDSYGDDDGGGVDDYDDDVDEGIAETKGPYCYMAINVCFATALVEYCDYPDNGDYDGNSGL